MYIIALAPIFRFAIYEHFRYNNKIQNISGTLCKLTNRLKNRDDILVHILNCCTHIFCIQNIKSIFVTPIYLPPK